MPDLGGMHHLSSVLLGEKSVSIARLLAERLSASSKEMVLVSFRIESELDSTICGKIVKVVETMIGRAMSNCR